MRKEKFERKLHQFAHGVDQEGDASPSKSKKILKSTEYLKEVILRDMVKEKKKSKPIKPTVQRQPSSLVNAISSVTPQNKTSKEEIPEKSSGRGGGGGLLEMLRKGGLIGKKKEEEEVKYDGNFNLVSLYLQLAIKVKAKLEKMETIRNPLSQREFLFLENSLKEKM